MSKSIYLIKSLDESCYKIGVSKNPTKRIRQLQTGNSYELELIYEYKTENAYKIESILHRRYSHLNKNKEWFDLSILEEVSFLSECMRIENDLKILIDSENHYILNSNN